ncbi:hypothetical protein APA_927 [Pseudanabaena sp. lw0831]|nr:hypothetical protein APA_927 [Pseudanabaena sp. lw0831]
MVYSHTPKINKDVPKTKRSNAKIRRKLIANKFASIQM